MNHSTAKEALCQAMYRLMNRRAISRIRIEDILTEAGVSKSSFYRYFRDKYELMNYCYEKAIREITMLQPDGNMDAILRSIFQFYIDNKAFILNGFNITGEDSLKNYIYKTTCGFCADRLKQYKGRSELLPEEQLAINYYVGGSIQLIHEWLSNSNQNKLSSAEAAQIHESLIPDVLKPLYTNTKR